MTQILRKITIDEVYISPLKRRRVIQEDGTEVMVDVPHTIRPSGSMIMDAVVQCIVQYRKFRVYSIARRLGVDPLNLRAAMQLLTQMPMLEFLNMFRLRMTKEYLTCTDLTLTEIAKRCDWSGQAALCHSFKNMEGCAPIIYRNRYRPKNFKDLYEW